jgi:hypothetical protein
MLDNQYRRKKIEQRGDQGRKMPRRLKTRGRRRRAVKSKIDSI